MGNLECDIQYPISLGTTKIFQIHADIECNNQCCLIASRLNHRDTLTNSEKLQIQASALRQSLSLAEAKMVKSITSSVMIGGWRLELEEALSNMVSVYLRAVSLSASTPNLAIYIINTSGYPLIFKKTTPTLQQMDLA